MVDRPCRLPPSCGLPPAGRRTARWADASPSPSRAPYRAAPRATSLPVVRAGLVQQLRGRGQDQLDGERDLARLVKNKNAAPKGGVLITKLGAGTRTQRYLTVIPVVFAA